MINDHQLVVRCLDSSGLPQEFDVMEVAHRFIVMNAVKEVFIDFDDKVTVTFHERIREKSPEKDRQHILTLFWREPPRYERHKLSLTGSTEPAAVPKPWQPTRSQLQRQAFGRNMRIGPQTLSKPSARARS